MEAAAAPPPPPPAPSNESRLTVGGVINEALDLYGKHVGTAARRRGDRLRDRRGHPGDPHRRPRHRAARLVASIVGLVASTLFTGFVVTLVADVRDGKQDSSVGEMMSSASHAILRLIGNGILGGIAIGIGFVLLIVPGLYLLTIWAVVAPAIVAERRGVIEAFGRSYELVRGHGWTVFGAIVVAFLILIGGRDRRRRSSGLRSADLAGRIIFTIIANILVAPFPALVASVLFFGLGGTSTAVGRDAAIPPAGARDLSESPALRRSRRAP